MSERVYRRFFSLHVANKEFDVDELIVREGKPVWIEHVNACRDSLAALDPPLTDAEIQTIHAAFSERPETVEALSSAWKRTT